MPDGISRRARSAGRRPWPWLCLLAVLLLPTTAALADDSANQQPPETAPTTAPLTMAQAVAMATAASDPEAVRFAARARALDNQAVADAQLPDPMITAQVAGVPTDSFSRSEEHTSELQSRGHLVCRLLLEKKKINHAVPLSILPHVPSADPQALPSVPTRRSSDLGASRCHGHSSIRPRGGAVRRSRPGARQPGRS